MRKPKLSAACNHSLDVLLIVPALYHLDNFALDTTLDDVVVFTIRILFLREDQVQHNRNQACDQD